MAQTLFLSKIGPNGLESHPVNEAIDLTTTAYWLDVVDPDGISDDAEVEVLRGWADRFGAPEWLDMERLARSGARPEGPSRRPGKIRVADDSFISRFSWVEPEELDLKEFMREVLIDASGRGDDRPVRHEVRALCGPGYLLTLRYVDGDAVAAHEKVASVLRGAHRYSEAPQGAQGAAILARMLDQALEDQLDAIEGYDEMADDLQDQVLAAAESKGGAPDAYSPEDIQRGLAVLRREVGLLRRLLIPYGELRELTQDPIPIVRPLMNEYSDLREGVLRVAEWIDTVRDLLTSTYEVLLARQANDTNIVMKKLTAWAAIVLVPTLITGVYGMNFENMPELSLAHGYYGAMVLIVGSAVTLYVVFRKKGWL